MSLIVDLSYHKGYPDVDALVAQGVIANIHKVSDGYYMPISIPAKYDYKNHLDITFISHWQEFGEKMQWRGGYHYARLDEENGDLVGRPNILEQADIFVGALEKYGLRDNDYVILDFEQNLNELGYLEKAEVGRRVEKMILAVENRVQRKPIIYTGAWWWQLYHQGFDYEFFKEYPFWLSHYWPIQNNQLYYTGSYYYIKPARLFPRAWRDALNKRIAYANFPTINDIPTMPRENVFMWQYSASGTLNGVSGGVDLSLEVIPESEWSMARKPSLYTPPLDDIFVIPD